MALSGVRWLPYPLMSQAKMREKTMTKEERRTTILNVISDLEYVLSYADDDHDGEVTDDLWSDAELAVEYITENNPHL